MQSLFEVKFPLVVKWDDKFTVTFNLQKGNALEFKGGVYFLHGDNGSGKTTFLNLLALTAGDVGKGGKTGAGSIAYNGEAYNGPGFNHIRAAELRERYFCIFPQKVFFLPVSTRDNYIVLNGSDRNREASFSLKEYPDLLSGGQQQKVLMDIILDEKKPVWFLDEPLSNLDAERRHYFWVMLEKAYKISLQTAFFIDHWMGREIKNDRHFCFYNTLQVVTENRQKDSVPEIESRYIEIYENNAPLEFFARQIEEHLFLKTGAAKEMTNGVLCKGLAT